MRGKLASLSEYVKEIKQGFSRYYNKLHQRRGFFWGGRFKSVLVDSGEALINCLAYIDLNPVRAGIVKKPEEYRWCSLGYHVQAGNKDDFLSLDFGLGEFGDDRQRLGHYRHFVYEKGAIEPRAGEIKAGQRLELTATDRFRCRSRYFTDSGIIGAKEFVARFARIFVNHFHARHEKKPKSISGLAGLFSLKRLAE